MLFNSYVFLLFFLPLTWIGYTYLRQSGAERASKLWLVLASFLFYAWWKPAYLPLLLVSILANLQIGRRLGQRPTRWLLASGIALNLALLGYFKYANFLVDNFSFLSGQQLALDHIALPLAISFFTFQQVSYLIDSYRGETRDYDVLHYALFVSFFPQLIAGPIVHHREMMPQFQKGSLSGLDYEQIAIGLGTFAIGLFKKVVIADGIALYANRVFDAAAIGTTLTLPEAWGGAVAYALQLYFDFSGYCDMAIGLGLLFGIKLPLNFASPYKATSIIDFWRRWHITLSRFLRDCLYIPLGGSRKGTTRRHVNLMATMLLGGLWHGAAWTFVIWGGLHGLFLVINHGWRAICQAASWDLGSSRVWAVCARLLTFAAVVSAWVFFRASSSATAVAMLESMTGTDGVVLPVKYLDKWGAFSSMLQEMGVRFTGDTNLFSSSQVRDVLVLLIVVWCFPNTQQIMSGAAAECPAWLRFRPTRRQALATAALSVWSVLSLSRVSEFLYFNF